MVEVAVSSLSATSSIYCCRSSSAQPLQPLQRHPQLHHGEQRRDRAQDALQVPLAHQVAGLHEARAVGGDEDDADEGVLLPDPGDEGVLDVDAPAVDDPHARVGGMPNRTFCAL